MLKLVRRPSEQIVITNRQTGARCVISPPRGRKEINTALGFTADPADFQITREKVEVVETGKERR